MTETRASILEPDKGESAVLGEHRAQTPINHILERLSPLELPAKDSSNSSSQSLNHKRARSTAPSLNPFFSLYGKSGKYDLKDLERHLKPSSSTADGASRFQR